VLSEVVTSTTNFAQRLSALDPEIRHRVLQFLSSAPVAVWLPAGDALLRRNLFLLRETMRESLPANAAPPGDVPELVVDVLLAVDDRHYCLIGWMRSGKGRITGLTVVSPEGERVEVLEQVFRVPRPDVGARGAAAGNGDDHPGFRCAFELTGGSRSPDGWTVTLRDDAGVVIEAPAPPAVLEAASVRGAVLAELARERSLHGDLMERHYLPLLGKLQERLDQPADPTDVMQYGTPPNDPAVSIVVPLYGSVHFLEHQLAQFASDPEVGNADLVYVLDSPELAEDLRRHAADLFEIYGAPFRLAILPRNVGFAGVNNVGASLARASLLLLCNSDVLPERRGWLGRLAEFYRSTPGIGALGPKLLYEDDSIQHAGMYFRMSEEPGVWENMHFHKGLHRSTPAANVTRTVPAVTAACLMIDRELFLGVGGLRSIYVQGDYEDSDLCLRLAERGLDSWYLADVELYHLEGQSYPAALRQSASRYNRWLHTRLWGERIARLASAAAGRRNGPPPPPLEILDVQRASDDRGALHGFEIDAPGPGTRSGLHALNLEGWVLGRTARAVSLEVVDGDTVFQRLPVNEIREDVAAAHPGVERAERSGFRAAVNAVGLPAEFELTVRARLEDESRADLAVLRGRRRFLSPTDTRGPAPLLVTTCGRTGSTWLVRLLAEHPQIVAYRPFQYEPRVASYWVQVLRRLSEPSSYLQSLATQLTDETWWLGGRWSHPVEIPDPAVEDWIGRGGLEALATLCRQRIQGFYQRVAALQSREGAGYFVEKCAPERFTRSLIFELFPGTREIVLVRDFRDVICSMLAYNRITPGAFGRDLVGTDEDFVHRIGHQVRTLLAAHRDRSRASLLVRYEDLVRDPQAALEAILCHLELERRGSTITEMLRDPAARERRRPHMTSPSVSGSVGRWRSELDEGLQQACGEAFRDALAAFGYS
jgi:GT2 family glycosyltransferase